MLDVSTRSVYIEPGAARAGRLACEVVEVSPLLRQLLMDAVDMPADYDPAGRDGRWRPCCCTRSSARRFCPCTYRCRRTSAWPRCAGRSSPRPTRARRRKPGPAACTSVRAPSAAISASRPAWRFRNGASAPACGPGLVAAGRRGVRHRHRAGFRLGPGRVLHHVPAGAGERAHRIPARGLGPVPLVRPRTRAPRRSGRQCRRARTDARRSGCSASGCRARRTPRRRCMPARPPPATTQAAGGHALDQRIHGDQHQPAHGQVGPVEMAGRLSRLLAFRPTPSSAMPRHTRPNNVSPRGRAARPARTAYRCRRSGGRWRNGPAR